MTKTSSKPFSILITDDDDGCRETLREILEPQGFSTVQASSGEEALDIAHHEAIHLALLDMHLPRMTGLETLRLLHQIQALLPCILVTGDASAELMRQAIQAHAYSVLHKPVSRGSVLYTITRALIRFYGKLDEEAGGEDEPPRENPSP